MPAIDYIPNREKYVGGDVCMIDSFLPTRSIQYTLERARYNRMV
jgi:hypothetical protein